MRDWWIEAMGRRPAWMNALLVFCAYMAFVYVPWDFLVKPVATDREAWFGLLLSGWAAKATEPLHWAIYGAGVYGFWRMRPWMWPWAAIYAAQVAIGMAVWPILHFGGLRGVATGLAAFIPLSVLTVALWRARSIFRAPRPSLRERYGDWALVTGASAGIGTAFARALAREGVSVVLAARRTERLRELGAELEKASAVATRVVAVDLASADGPERLAQAVADLEIAILVNNAGFGLAGRFERQDAERLREMVQLNCVAPLWLTRRLLPGMRQRGRGAVLFTGSIAAKQPLPLHNVYAATKVFDGFLGEALWAEMRGSGVDVLVVEPGPTETEFQEVAGEIGHPGQSPDEVVAIAFEALGRQPSVATRWLDWLRGNAGMRIMPRSLLTLAAKAFITRQTPPELR
jgi:short-subunit dehydrogenase